MFEDRNMNESKKCSNCGSENIVGPYHVHRGRIYLGIITSVGRETYICVDCYHIMDFIRKGDRDRVEKEAQKLFSRYQ